eukprot:TRINITY_DN29645_c0_g1_i2.p1 TRINITY_DN29645_c0_g1~~TRINITY_DN29645_c0_g1_i2.p1  ORF type:complete len:263 (-),score=66.95 TRINITY_DN29645_c0_g1_i2:169-879(-)
MAASVVRDWRKTDPAYVAAEDDDGLPRDYFKMAHCPLHEECSAQAWRRANVFSYVSPEECHQKALNHLVVSSKHNRSKDDAEAILSDFCDQIEVTEETAEERAAYREWADKEFEKEAAKKQAKPVAPATGGGQKRQAPAPMPSSSSGAGQVPTITFAAGGQEGRLVRKRIDNPEMMRLTFRQAELLRDSLRRAREATENSQRLATSLASQFGAEGQVITAAHNVVEALINEQRWER